MPVSIQVHHALVDGIHVGLFFGALAESLATWAKALLKINSV
jgi:chloramphenicol O-acetyltransferase